MVSIIPMDPSKINTDMPLELLAPIISKANMYSYIIKKRNNFIDIYDFYTLELVKVIETFYIHHLSVSKCGKFIVCSNETIVRIFKLDDSSIVQDITVNFVPIYDEKRDGNLRLTKSEGNGEPIHTFTVNNDLLIACGNSIIKYSLDINRWNKVHTYVLPDDLIIVKITSNLTTNTFACGTLGGSVYVFDMNINHLIYDFTTVFGLIRSDGFPEIVSIAFNKNVLVASSMGGNNILLDLNTNTQKIVKGPPFIRSGNSFSIKNYLLTPCCTKFIGYSMLYRTTCMWDALTGEFIKTLDINMDQQDCIFAGSKLISCYGERISIYEL